MIRTASRPIHALAACLALAAAPLAACGGDDSGDGDGDGGDDTPAHDADPNTPDAAVAACTPRAGTDLTMELVASNLDEPLLVTAPPGDPRLFVVEKAGVIKIIRDGEVLGTPFLDITDRVLWDFAPNEQGLLGLAFHPSYATNGWFYVFYIEAGTGANVVTRFQVSAEDPDQADVFSEEPILSVPDDRGNHNGGMIDFGPDGYLYIGLGDGGGSNDPDDNGQDLTTLLGNMLRIDVDGGGGGEPYGIPDDNPYAGAAGENPPQEEIWLSGLRNPWRWSFDRQTGEMYIADVGQGDEEEVDVIPAGQGGLNMGWPLMEGTICRVGDCSAFTAPVAVYDNPDLGRSITGGYVYRGGCAPDLDGWYFYGDWSSERIWKFVYQGGEATELEEVTGELDPGGVIDGLASFGQDSFGEVYVVSLNAGEIYRITVE